MSEISLKFEINKKRLGKKIDLKDQSFIFTNKIGSYLYLSLDGIIRSRYQGFYYCKSYEKTWELIKTIENIQLNSKPITQIINKFYLLERKRSNITESFFLPHNFNTLVYEVINSKNEDVILSFDVKKLFDNRNYGRFYNVYEKNGFLIIEFTKKTDQSEDQTSNEEEYKLFTVINTNMSYEKIDSWEEINYEIDRKRNSEPYQKYVYKPLKLKTNKNNFLIITSSSNLKKAMSESILIKKNLKSLKSKQKNYINNLLKTKLKIKNKEIYFAYLSSIFNIDSLIMKIRNNLGIYAGIPWFTQFWARDEIISTKALMYINKKEEAKKILFNYVDHIGHKDFLPNKRPNATYKSADSIGWLFYRINDLTEFTNIKNDLVHIDNQLRNILKHIITNRAIGDFIKNNEYETWMDSITREGIRIEIQALQLFMYNFMKKIHPKNKSYELLENDLKLQTNNKFWNGNYIKDGLNDNTIRNNIFMAYYIYPYLLNQESWLICFRNALIKLWNDWGGISSLDRTLPEFKDLYTGEDGKSYHNGDSWFYLNNIAAIVLNRLHRKEFKIYIQKILNASVKDILYKGAISHHSEVSSSKEQDSNGCLSQLWSTALFIELINELYGNIK